MLDKNHGQDFGQKVMQVLEKNTPSSILYEEPFLKALFLEKVMENSAIPVLCLDFDLLYSGLVSAGILPHRDNTYLYRPAGEPKKTLRAVLERVAREKSVVIIDSLNGFYSAFEQKDAGRFINSYIMLLAFVARGTGSQVILASMARIREGEPAVLSPTGRRIITSGSITNMRLGRDDAGALMSILDKRNVPVRSIRIFG